MAQGKVGDTGPPDTSIAAGPGVTPEDWRRRIGSVLATGGPTTVFQPIVDLVRGTVVGYEALPRFEGHPALSPLAWFEAARALGLSPQLEAAAVRAALEHRAGLPVNTFLTVNLGPELLLDPSVREVLEEHHDLGGVVIELTEQTRLDSYSVLQPGLDALRSRGAMFALDDVGSGYAGLQHLLGFRPELVKLDRSLVAGVDTDMAKRALVSVLGTVTSHLDA